MKFYSDLKTDPNQWRYKLIEMGPMKRAPDAAKTSNLTKSSKAAYAASFKKCKIDYGYLKSV